MFQPKISHDSDGVETSVRPVKGPRPMTLQETEPRASFPYVTPKHLQKASSLEHLATRWVVDPEAIQEVGGVGLSVPVPHSCIHLLLASRLVRTCAFGGGVAAPEHHG